MPVAVITFRCKWLFFHFASFLLFSLVGSFLFSEVSLMKFTSKEVLKSGFYLDEKLFPGPRSLPHACVVRLLPWGRYHNDNKEKFMCPSSGCAGWDDAWLSSLAALLHGPEHR